jgi:hypothetical protein
LKLEKYLLVIVALVATVPVTNVNASGLGISDFPDHPEAVCMSYGDDPEMEDLCKNIDVCDQPGGIDAAHKFCTGEAVRNNPYPPGGCPEGFHSEEDDETGLCYSNEGGCEYPDLVLTNDNKSCVSDNKCDWWPDGPYCLSKKIYCASEDLNRVKEYCFSNKDSCIVELDDSRCSNADVASELKLGNLSEYTPWKQVDCEAEVDDPLCTGNRGKDGFLYCDLKDKFPDPIYMYCIARDPPLPPSRQ